MDVDALLESGALSRVPANRDLAREYLTHARRHLSLSQKGVDDDAVGAFQLAYDASRKALAAVLIAQGLRPTFRGGHIVLQDVVAAQFTPAIDDVVRGFRRMRRVRNESEYPTDEHPVATARDARQAQRYCADTMDTINAADRLIELVPNY